MRGCPPVRLRARARAVHGLPAHAAIPPNNVLACPMTPVHLWTTRRQAGFSLIEVLVSILIFSMISIAMLTVFNLASTIFRETEAARTADDEAAIALAMLEDDLARMVPAANGGYFFAQVLAKDQANVDLPANRTGGNMVISFTIDVGSALRADNQGRGLRRVVAWWTDDYGRLWRGVKARDSHDKAFDVLTDIYSAGEGTDDLTPSARQQVIRGCLHLSVDIAGPGIKNRALSAAGTTPAWNWEFSKDGAAILPTASDLYRTEPQTANGPKDPWPEAIRLTLITAGGGKKDTANPARYATRGFLASSSLNDTDDTGIKVAGIRVFPAQGGALLRLGDPSDPASAVEWLSYTGVSNGALSGVTRARLRSGADPAANPPVGHAFTRNAPVAIGRVHTLVRILPP
jgi:prepilin-type N-terminal cleavage/methylation domain-containing protein